MPGRVLSFLRNCKISISFCSSTSRSYSIASVDFTSTLTPTQQSRIKDLTNSLSSSTDPSYVWANYSNLIALLGNEPLPLEIHQQVLRRCTPPWRELRDTLVQELKAGRRSFVPPDIESRFQSLVANIRSTGAELNVDDYNFILSQFASYGYYEGTSKLYEEMKRVGIKPNYRTFEYCFRAMGYRLSLPIHKEQRQRAVAHVQSLFNIYVEDMKAYNVPMTARSLDLGLRIMKETIDLNGLENILRQSYAIDLSNLDRIPLEYSENAKDNPIPFQFTTTSLNTTLDTLGMVGSVSKLVQAFEVLTQPLPQASQHFFNSFESDEEGDFGITVDVTPFPTFPIPSARPNTTSYGILLRYLCNAGHHILARHYIIEAIRLHTRTSWILRCQVVHHHAKKKPLHEIPRPHFAINRLMLLPVLGESNRDKNLALMKWLVDKLPKLIKSLKNDLSYYSTLLHSLQQSGHFQTVTGEVSSAHALFDADIEETPTRPKDQTDESPFDLNLHVEILRRNVNEIEYFEQRLKKTCARTTQRVKERLGRRVWKGKNVYLQDEQTRVPVTKQIWKSIVNFKDASPHPGQRPDQPVGSRRISTLAPGFYAHSKMVSPPLPLSQRDLNQSEGP